MLNLLKLLLIGVLLISTKFYAKAEAVLSASLKQYSVPEQSRFLMGQLDSGFLLKQKNPVYARPTSMSGEDVFKIEASDAIGGVKYSQPDIAYSLLRTNGGMKVPFSTFSKHRIFGISSQNPSRVNFPIFGASEKDTLKPVRDMRFLDSLVNDETLDKESDNSKSNNLHQIDEVKDNFAFANDNLVSVSSDAVLSYEIPVIDLNGSSTENSTQILTEHTTPKSVHLYKHVYIDSMNHTEISPFPSIVSDENVTNSLPSTDSEKKLSSGTVAGIVIAVLISVTILSSAVIYLLYRKFNGKCTSVVESKFNSDNCGYLDDSLRSSIYLNNHIELPKESSEEMTSLDNDSFLNSLETMTIQNYWADSSKNTKV